MDAQGFEVVAGVRSGDLLAGKYRVERVLGAGGMGVVVEAHHIQLETKVALKFLLPTMMSDEEAVGRFVRESRAAAKIANEHVARVLDVGQLETGAPYMVMEFLEGSDLSNWLATRGPLSVEQTVEYVLQACEAIAEAHSLGIVHRDLKPANLFRVERADGIACIKVLDFGISKIMSVGASSPRMAMTRTAIAMGSPLYMSPEQMESAREVDRRTDIWALGIILHELLTGKVPFDGTTLPEVCMKIATRAPPLLRSSCPDAPAAVEVAIQRCLQKDREKRYSTVAELAAVLTPFGPPRSRISAERIARITPSAPASQRGAYDSMGLASGQHPMKVTTGTLGTLGRTMAEPLRRHRGIALAAIAAVAVACAAVTVGWVVRRPSAVANASPAAPPVPVPLPSLAMPQRLPALAAPQPELAPIEHLPFASSAPTGIPVPTRQRSPGHGPAPAPRVPMPPAPAVADVSGAVAPPKSTPARPTPPPAPTAPPPAQTADPDPFSRLKPL